MFTSFSCINFRLCHTVIVQACRNYLHKTFGHHSVNKEIVMFIEVIEKFYLNFNSKSKYTIYATKWNSDSFLEIIKFFIFTENSIKFLLYMPFRTFLYMPFRTSLVLSLSRQYKYLNK